MRTQFAVVDLFAGPGGLAEGFSAVRDGRGASPFSIVLSVEADVSAHSTLLLRTFIRQFGSVPPREYYDFLNSKGAEPNWSALYPREWRAAEQEALCLRLGTQPATSIVNGRIQEIRKHYGDNTVLIGGPPCQAYSLVGRARNAAVVGYKPELDHRHFLYREYVKILESLEPAAFVMENVKGVLSSSVNGGGVFERIVEDLRNAGGAERYRLFGLSPRALKHGISHEPAVTDFIVRAEEFGVPQARHRVFVVGLRCDVARQLMDHSRLHLTRRARRTRTDDVLGTMPELRSGLSGGSDSAEAWVAAVREAADQILAAPPRLPDKQLADFCDLIGNYRKRFIPRRTMSRAADFPVTLSRRCPIDLRAWLYDPLVLRFPNNETRGHMKRDLARYMFAATFAKVTGRSPKACDFPRSLAPDHRNWRSGKFADRFRVQLADQPSSTVTSHISKDGHYFIHWDPAQCRSLTVREAARLQTFPDNYFFKGNRTQQYVQVGNAVPPFLAHQIAQVLHEALTTSAVASPGTARRAALSLTLMDAT